MLIEKIKVQRPDRLEIRLSVFIERPHITVKIIIVRGDQARLGAVDPQGIGQAVCRAGLSRARRTRDENELLPGAYDAGRGLMEHVLEHGFAGQDQIGRLAVADRFIHVGNIFHIEEMGKLVGISLSFKEILYRIKLADMFRIVCGGKHQEQAVAVRHQVKRGDLAGAL